RMAASTLSFGMLTARAFCITRRRAGLLFGSEPPDLTAMVMSLLIFANCFAMRFQRANIVCFLTSKMRPMVAPLTLEEVERQTVDARSLDAAGIYSTSAIHASARRKQHGREVRRS